MSVWVKEKLKFPWSEKLVQIWVHFTFSKGIVCVTGGGGFIASWLVKLLLSNGYKVHGTVRDPCDAKNAHLMMLDNAAENLKLFKADLLDYNSLLSAFTGCEGVFHTATPVPFDKLVDPEVEMITPAITGTRNVLKACSEVKIKRVVIVSSIAAVFVNPSWPTDKWMDESCWSDKEHCRKIEQWYCYAKTLAEEEAFKYSQETGLDIVTVLPSLVFGPMLQTTMNTSNLWLITLMKGKLELFDEPSSYVDVRDVADALLLTYEKPEAKGRYICGSHAMSTLELIQKLKGMYPDFKYPTCQPPARKGVTSEKLKALGWKFRNFDDGIKETVEFFKEKGYLLV